MRKVMKKRKWMALAVCSTAVMFAVTGCQTQKSSTDDVSQTTVQADENSNHENQSDGNSNAGNANSGKQDSTDTANNSSSQSSETLCLTSVPKYQSEWKDQKQLFNGHVDQMYLMADGHEALKQALKTFNQNQEQELDQIYQDNKEFFDMQTGEDSTPLAYEVSVIPKRSDEQIVSLSVEEYDYLGGAHPNSMITGYNLNPQTGKRYTLQDIAQDYDGIFDYVQKKLKEDYAPDMFFDGYEDTVKSMFYGDADGANGADGVQNAQPTDSSADFSDTEMLSWTMDKNGVTIVFNNYDLAPYAAGRQIVEIPFAEEGNLFKKEFIPESATTNGNTTKDTKTSVGEAKIQPLYVEQEVAVDLDGDGNKETVKLSTQTDSQTGAISLFAETGSASAFLLSDGDGMDDLGDFGCWLIQTGDNRTYLYVETKEANDFRSLHIFDLSTKGITYCGVSDDSFYGSVMTNPDDFILFRRSDMLSTYSVFRHYAIGEDGMPKPLSDDFTVSGIYLDEELTPTLTTKQEVSVWVDNKQEKLSKGTVLKLKATDDSTYVTAETADGKTCQIRLDANGEDVYPRTIDGIPENECFDGIQYAG